MTLLLAAAATSLFFTEPQPLNMPRAEAYLVTQGARSRLEDRYGVLDLWTSQAVLGRWMDDDGRVFTLSRLKTVPPVFRDVSRTRTDYAADRRDMLEKDLATLRLAISHLAPCEPADEPDGPRHDPRGIATTLYYHGTNTSAIVCAFLPKEPRCWYLATWELMEGDDFDFCKREFEEEFLEKWDDVVKERLATEREYARLLGGKERKAKSRPTERELLRADARHSVANYPMWHVTDGDEFSVLDDLPATSDFVASFTNDLKRMRLKYAEAIPSPLDGSNTLCVARIFRDRNEYLDAVGDDMKWSAAYWSQRRREIVACLPPRGEAELLKTLRHEAFHQYLSYACAMVQASPWFNEGYAEYFEDTESADWNLPITEDGIEEAANLIPALMAMDYDAFYGGSDEERRFKYRLAWSLAYFIEKGAPDVAGEPFKNLKRDYVDALLRLRDMRLATEQAFSRDGMLREFVAEWTRFWTDR